VRVLAWKIANSWQEARVSRWTRGDGFRGGQYTRAKTRDVQPWRAIVSLALRARIF
jgi:hypothetical protein